MNKTTLPRTKIFLSLAVYFLLPLCASTLNQLVNNMTITNTLIFSLTALILVWFNWDLLQVHGQRFKTNSKDGVLFLLIGILSLSLLQVFNLFVFKLTIAIPEKSILQSYYFFTPIILLAFSFCQAISYSLTFKIFVDRIHLNLTESKVILISGFFFGLLCTIALVPASLLAFAMIFIYQFILATLISYLYNQTHSIVPFMIAYALVLLVQGLTVLL